MGQLTGLVSALLCALAAATSANAATVSPGSLSWAAVAVGNRGGQKVVTLTNASAAVINIAGISFSGTNPTDFILYSKTCGATLAAGASCTANILFGPTATGNRTAILNFSDSDGNSPQTAALTGLGTSGVVAASPSSIAFASTAVGSSAVPQTVTLTNGNTSPITIGSVAVTGANASDFVVSGTTCGASLSVNASCTATLVFKPSAAGTRTANLTFTDSAVSSPQAVALSGVGGVTPATASASPTSLSFSGTAVGASSTAQTVTLMNGPGAPLTISIISVSGANASDFVLSSTTCGSSMAVSATCTATIVFQPSATGVRTASLSFVDSATNSPQLVALSGSGASTGATAASPSGLSWAAVAVGTRSGQKVVTLTNANAGAITLNSISFSGASPADFTVFSKTCGATLAAGASCTANIVFGPTATGTRAAILNFNDSDTNSPQAITLSGTGTTGVVVASPSSLAFGNTALGTSTAAQAITVSNGNTSPITISSIAVTGANASDFLLTAKTCGASLSVNASCTVTLVFKPSTIGVRNAGLSFTDSAVSSPQAVALSGFGGALLTISPQTPTVVVNGTVHFTSTVASTWTASCGSIGSDGTFTAPATTGSCTVTATATDGSGQTASTSVTLAPASVIITPDSVPLHALNVQTFTANQPVTWSSSCGTISSAGVFTAPGSAATCTITAVASSVAGLSATATASVDIANYTAWKGGGGLLGAQTNELSLTPSNVNAATFGLQWTAPVDGWVNAQPLYMNGLMVNGAPHNVVFFVTANDSVYAFDADTGVPLWQVSLIPPGATAVTGTASGLTSAPLIGILGTPVIDPATDTMYLVAETLEQSGTSFVHRLHALDVATGSEKFGGPVLVNDPQMAPMHKLQRTGMTLANGNVYFGIGSMQDMQPYHGLVFAFNAQTLAQQAVWATTPTGSEGGVWMGGSAPAVDADGNIYVTTGNGTLDGSANFGEAAVKLSPGLQLLDYFAPYNFATYNAADVDLGSGNVIVVPDQAGPHPHELIACGKPTPVYVLDRDNLGQLGTVSDNVIQRLDNQLGIYSAATNSVQACFTAPAMWGQNVYFGGKYDVLKMFTLDPNTGQLSSAPVSQGTLAFGYPGGNPVVSANGATNGIVWSIDTKTNSLIANDATNLATTLFTGALSAPAIRWTMPTVVNGHAYVGEKGMVFGFGLK
jgi:Abnormal spindle-like microcephaly-assoc'd, ASPM-SPD-2-Hydin/PQQ-like domain